MIPGLGVSIHSLTSNVVGLLKLFLILVRMQEKCLICWHDVSLDEGFFAPCVRFDSPYLINKENPCD
jgi:hypothetical protein